jgi:single-strand DNA-binding protein
LLENNLFNGEIYKMSFNKIIAVGNLGRDPELRYTPQGNAVCDFSMATNEKKRDKAGEFQDVTTWFKVTLWGKQAENASKYLTKGRSVYVEGRLQTEEWTDRDGNKRFSLVIQGTDMHFIGGDNREETSSDSTSDNNFSALNNSGGIEPSSSASPKDDDIPF